MKNGLVALWLLMMIPLPGSDTDEAGRLGIDLSLQSQYSDNIFLNASKIGDFVTSMALDLSYAGQNLNFIVGGSATLFADNPDFNSMQFQGGLEWLNPLKNRDHIYLSLSYSQLNYRDLYTDFNHSGPVLNAHVKVYLSPSLLFKGGYQAEYRRYGNFTSFDFFNHTLFGEISRFFPSQTTLRASAAINYRFYPHIADPGTSEEIPSAYQGSGRFGNGRNQPQTAPAPGRSSHSLSVPNLSLLAGLAQGIGTRFGISTELEYRINFRGLEDAETLIQNAYTVYPYNDQYLWDGLRLSLTLKAIVWNEWAIEGSLSWLDKNYPGIYVMDESGTVQLPLVDRHDKQIQTDFSLGKKIDKWDISIGLSFIDNRSGDLFFTHTALSVFAGARFSF